MDTEINALTVDERLKLAEDILSRARRREFPDCLGLTSEELIEYREVAKKFYDILVDTLLVEPDIRDLVNFIREDLSRLDAEINNRLGAQVLNEHRFRY